VGPAGLLLMLLALGGLAVAVWLGLLSGPLWLDEALSVEIARRGLPGLVDALRQDGAPPLYYLLLHGWTAVLGTGTVVVRLPSVLLTVVALALVHRLGRDLGGVAAGRAAVVVLATLPWTARYATETRMYLLVVVLVLAGALLLRRLHRAPDRAGVLALGAVTGALLLTHYWSLFLLAAVAALHVPGVLRRQPPALAVAASGALGAVAFLPWLPVFLFQRSRTGAPWSDAPGLPDLLWTPRLWGLGSTASRTALAVVLVPLLAIALVRGGRRARAVAAVTGLTLLLGWAATAVQGGAYAARYTAVVVPLVAVLTGLGAAALRGQVALMALAALAGVGLGTGLASVHHARTPAGGIADAVRTGAPAGELLVSCPDQLGPPLARLLGEDYEQVVYPTLGPSDLVDWIDYEQRNAAADPAQVAARLEARAGDRGLLLLMAPGYRTLVGHCEALHDALEDRRGEPDLLFGRPGSAHQQLYRFAP
jgi:mannosyltransferase